MGIAYPNLRALSSRAVEVCLGTLIALAPRRHWAHLERRFHVGPYLMLSAVLSLTVGIVIGVPAFSSHLSAAMSAASRLTIRAAAAQIQRPEGPEPTTRLTSALSAMFIVSFVLTPVGFLTTYLAASGVFRAACVWFDDPLGDPVLTLLDAMVRRLRLGAAGAIRRVQQRRRFGSAVPDEVVRGAAAGFANADFVVMASRPKEGWTKGLMIVADDGAYRVVDVVEKTIDRHTRVLYVLQRKTDSEILRRTIRYALPAYDRHVVRSTSTGPPD